MATFTPFTPLTQDQFQSAQKAGFDTDTIIANEQRRKEESAPATRISGMMKGYQDAPTTAFNLLTQSEQGLGRAIGQSWAVNSSDFDAAQKSAQGLSDMQFKAQKRINEKKALGEDTSNLENVLAKAKKLTGIADVSNIAPDSQETILQALGQVGGVGLDMLSGGTYGVEKTAGMQSLKLAPKMVKPSIVSATADILKNPSKLLSVETAKKVGIGAGIGYGYDVSNSLQNKKENPLTPGLGTAIGSAVPFLSEVGGKFGIPYQVNQLEQKYDEWAGLTKPGVKMINKAENKTAQPPCL